MAIVIVGSASCSPTHFGYELAVAAQVLVVGAGGIGGIVAARLVVAGHDVCVETTNREIAQAIERDGIVIEGVAPVHAPSVRVGPQAGQTFDWIILATQPPSVEAAAKSALPYLSARGHMVVLQNGLCEARVAQIVGADRVLGAIVSWGASVSAPGVYRQTARGAFTIGRPNGAIDAAVLALTALLSAVAPARATNNLIGARYSKLAFNCAVSSIGTIAGESLGPLLWVSRYRRLGLDIITEAVNVARARDIQLETVAGTLDLNWLALTAAEQAGARTLALAAKHALVGALGAKYRHLRSSMLAAIERGRPPSVDFLNGEIVALGQKAGVPTPINARITSTIWAIARGDVPSSRATLDSLCA